MRPVWLRERSTRKVLKIRKERVIQPNLKRVFKYNSRRLMKAENEYITATLVLKKWELHFFIVVVSSQQSIATGSIHFPVLLISVIIPLVKPIIQLIITKSHQLSFPAEILRVVCKDCPGPAKHF